MNLSHLANAHEFADRPPPTAEDNQRIDDALNTIFNKGNNAMTEQTQEQAVETVDLEKLGADTSAAATALLEQDGWNIVTALQKILLTGINQTSLVVLPVQGNLELVLSKVSDPEGFTKIMSTLTYDISQLIEASHLLETQHKGKVGAVTAADLDQVQKIAFGYSELQGHLERAIQPLVLKVADILEEAGIHELEIK